MAQKELRETKNALEEEEVVRKAHEQTEAAFAAFSQELAEVSKKAIADVKQLYALVAEAVEGEQKNQAALLNAKEEIKQSLHLLQQGSDHLASKSAKDLDAISDQVRQFVGHTHGQLESAITMLQQSHEDLDLKQIQSLQEVIEESFTQMNSFLSNLQSTRHDICVKMKEGFDELGKQSESTSTEACARLGLIASSLSSTLSNLKTETADVINTMSAKMDAQLEGIEEMSKKFGLAMSTAQQQLNTADKKVSELVTRELERAAADKVALLEKVAKYISRSHESQVSSLKALEGRLSQELGGVGHTVTQAGTDCRDGLAAWRRDFQDAKHTFLETSVTDVASAIETAKTTESGNLARVQSQIKDQLDTQLKQLIDAQVSALGANTHQLEVVMAQASSLNTQQLAQCTDRVTDLSAQIRSSQDPVLHSIRGLQVLHQKTAAELNQEMSISEAQRGLDKTSRVVSRQVGVSRELVDTITVVPSWAGRVDAENAEAEIRCGQKRVRRGEYYEEVLKKAEQPKRTKRRESLIAGMKKE